MTEEKLVPMTGKIVTIEPTTGKTSILVQQNEGGAPTEVILRVDHDNYSAVFSLVMAAAVNKMPVSIWTVSESDGLMLQQVRLSFPAA